MGKENTEKNPSTPSAGGRGNYKSTPSTGRRTNHVAQISEKSFEFPIELTIIIIIIIIIITMKNEIEWINFKYINFFVILFIIII